MELISTKWDSRSGDIREHSGHILATQQWTDCSFLVGSQRAVELKAHKLLLALASPVFEAMFYGPIAERGDAPIRIPDVEPDTFQAMLNYIYTDKLVVGVESAAKDLYFAAQKYLISRLMLHCIRGLCNSCNPSNVCSLYEFGNMVEDDNLMEHCVSVIEDEPEEVLTSKEFLEANVDTVAKILSLDMEVPSEVPVIKGLVRYINAQNTEEDDSCLQQERGAGDGSEAEGPITQSRSRTSKETAGDMQPGPPLKRSHSHASKETAGASQSDPAMKMGDGDRPSTKAKAEQYATALRFLHEIRFLSMTPDQLYEVKSDLEPFLTAEEMSVIVNHVTAQTADPPGEGAVDMPEGFSTTKVPRRSLERPKHPKTAFQLWFQQESLKDEYNNLVGREIKEHADRIWNKLEDKTEWEEKAEKEQKRYDREHDIYSQKYPDDDEEADCDCSTCADGQDEDCSDLEDEDDLYSGFMNPGSDLDDDYDTDDNLDYFERRFIL